MEIPSIFDKLEFMDGGPVKLLLDKKEHFVIARATFKKGVVVGPQKGSHSAFLLILKGEVIFSKNNKEIHLRPHQYMKVQLGDTHGIQALEDTVILVING